MDKVYKLNWILDNGNLYASTVIKVMLADPDKRNDIITFWLEHALKANENWEKYECERHALAAHLANMQMGNKTVIEEFPGFFGKKPWWIWMKEQIEGNEKA